jgi:hypothetical protein
LNERWWLVTLRTQRNTSRYPRVRARAFILLAVAVALSSLISADALAATAAALPGDELWAKRVNGSADGWDVASEVGVSPDGSKVFVAGRSAESNGYDFRTAAYEASTGSALWAKRYDGPKSGSDQVAALGVSPDGAAVFVTGYSAGSLGDTDYATVAYVAATGAKLWAKRYDGPGNGAGSASSLAVSPDGSTVFVSGGSAGSASGSDYATVAYDASTGTELWVKRYNGPGNGADDASALSVAPGGGSVYVTGTSAGATSPVDYATLSYDASTGAKLWIKRYDGPGTQNNDWAEALGVSPNGSEVFVTGYSADSVTGSDTFYVTFAYDASTGAKLWQRTYDGSPDGTDIPFALAVGPGGGRVFVTGITTGASSNWDWGTVAYNASTGATRWTKRYNGPGNGLDEARGLGVSPDGTKVFVTGSSAQSSTDLDIDYATGAFDASTGKRLWVRSYNGPANADDYGLALGVSPDGSSVFTTGYSAGSSTGYDWATVAYAAT